MSTMTATASSVMTQDDIHHLLAGLEESDISLLLDDLNSTISSNVPVSEAIVKFSAPGLLPHELRSKSSLADLDVFGSASSTPAWGSRSTPRSSSATLDAEFRRQTKRISSAPEAGFSRPRSGSVHSRSSSPPPRESEPVPPVPALPPVLALPPIDLFAFKIDASPRLSATPAPTLAVKKNRESSAAPPAIKIDSVSAVSTAPRSSHRRSLRPAPSVPELSAVRPSRQQRAPPHPLPPLSTTMPMDSPGAADSVPSLVSSAAPSPVSSVSPMTPPDFMSLASVSASMSASVSSSGSSSRQQQQYQRLRHYKRISRPIVPLHPTKSSPDLRSLVAAYCDDTVRSPRSSRNGRVAPRAIPPPPPPPPMPALPGFASFAHSGASGIFGGHAGGDDGDDDVQLMAALLEPTPAKRPIGGGLAPTRNISGIFEVLDI